MTFEEWAKAYDEAVAAVTETAKTLDTALLIPTPYEQVWPPEIRGLSILAETFNKELAASVEAFFERQRECGLRNLYLRSRRGSFKTARAFAYASVVQLSVDTPQFASRMLAQALQGVELPETAVKPFYLKHRHLAGKLKTAFQTAALAVCLGDRVDEVATSIGYEAARDKATSLGKAKLTSVIGVFPPTKTTLRRAAYRAFRPEILRKMGLSNKGLTLPV